MRTFEDTGVDSVAIKTWDLKTGNLLDTFCESPALNSKCTCTI